MSVRTDRPGWPLPAGRSHAVACQAPLLLPDSATAARVLGSGTWVNPLPTPPVTPALSCAGWNVRPRSLGSVRRLLLRSGYPPIPSDGQLAFLLVPSAMRPRRVRVISPH